MEIYKQFLGSLIRYALSALVGALVARRIVPEALARDFVETAAAALAQSNENAFRKALRAARDTISVYLGE